MLDIEALLSRMTYQPNIEITWVPPGFIGDYSDHHKLKVVMWVLDARQKYPRPSRDAMRIFGLAMMGGEGPIRYATPDVRLGWDDGVITLDVTPRKVASETIIPWQIIESDDALLFYDWLDHVLQHIMTHEHREWFQVDGKPWKDPHPND